MNTVAIVLALAPPDNFASQVGRMGCVIALCLVGSTLAAAQNAPSGLLIADAQECTALVELNLEDAPGGPAIITSAQLMDVPANGVEQWIIVPSGYGNTNAQAA